jgi:hypothetical protein
MNTVLRGRVESLGRRLQWVVRGLLVATVLAVGASLARGGPLGLLRMPTTAELRPTPLSIGGGVAAIALGLLVPACYLVTLLAMHRLFGLYARGEVFGARPAAAVRLVGYGLLAMDPVRMLVTALTGPLLTALGLTQPFLHLELELSMLVAGLFVVALGAVLDLGRALDEDHQLTV